MKSTAFFWAKSEFEISNAFYLILYNEDESLYLNINDKKMGFSIRCVRE